ncbi:MAG: hydrogenase maturation protease, partial [Bacteroidales bacterium]
MDIKKKILVLGIGNEILTDDGIGLRLVKDLGMTELKNFVCFDFACSGGLEVIEKIKDFEQVVIIDAIRTDNGIPGDIYSFLPENFRETSHISNIHDINFIQAMELGKTLGVQLPEEVYIIAVEIFEDSEFGDELSGSVRKRYKQILENVYIKVSE